MNGCGKRPSVILEKYLDLKEKVNRWLREDEDEAEEELKRMIKEVEDARRRKQKRKS